MTIVEHPREEDLTGLWKCLARKVGRAYLASRSTVFTGKSQ